MCLEGVDHCHRVGITEVVAPQAECMWHQDIGSFDLLSYAHIKPALTLLVLMQEPKAVAQHQSMPPEPDKFVLRYQGDKGTVDAALLWAASLSMGHSPYANGFGIIGCPSSQAIIQDALKSAIHDCAVQADRRSPAQQDPCFTSQGACEPNSMCNHKGNDNSPVTDDASHPAQRQRQTQEQSRAPAAGIHRQRGNVKRPTASRRSKRQSAALQSSKGRCGAGAEAGDLAAATHLQQKLSLLPQHAQESHPRQHDPVPGRQQQDRFWALLAAGSSSLAQRITDSARVTPSIQITVRQEDQSPLDALLAVAAAAEDASLPTVTATGRQQEQVQPAELQHRQQAAAASDVCGHIQQGVIANPAKPQQEGRQQQAQPVTALQALPAELPHQQQQQTTMASDVCGLNQQGAVAKAAEPQQGARLGQAQPAELQHKQPAATASDVCDLDQQGIIIDAAASSQKGMMQEAANGTQASHQQAKAHREHGPQADVQVEPASKNNAGLSAEVQSVGQGVPGHSLSLLSCSSDSQLEAALKALQKATEFINVMRLQHHLLTCQRDKALRQVDSSSRAVAELKLQLAEARDKLAASESACAHEQTQSQGLQEEEAERLKQQAGVMVTGLHDPADSTEHQPQSSNASGTTLSMLPPLADAEQITDMPDTMSRPPPFRVGAPCRVGEWRQPGCYWCKPGSMLHRQPHNRLMEACVPALNAQPVFPLLQHCSEAEDPFTLSWPMDSPLAGLDALPALLQQGPHVVASMAMQVSSAEALQKDGRQPGHSTEPEVPCTLSWALDCPAAGMNAQPASMQLQHSSGPEVPYPCSPAMDSPLADLDLQFSSELILPQPCSSVDLQFSPELISPHPCSPAMDGPLAGVEVRPAPLPHGPLEAEPMAAQDSTAEALREDGRQLKPMWEPKVPATPSCSLDSWLNGIERHPEPWLLGTPEAEPTTMQMSTAEAQQEDGKQLQPSREHEGLDALSRALDKPLAGVEGEPGRPQLGPPGAKVLAVQSSMAEAQQEESRQLQPSQVHEGPHTLRWAMDSLVAGMEVQPVLLLHSALEAEPMAEQDKTAKARQEDGRQLQLGREHEEPATISEALDSPLNGLERQPTLLLPRHPGAEPAAIQNSRAVMQQEDGGQLQPSREHERAGTLSWARDSPLAGVKGEPTLLLQGPPGAEALAVQSSMAEAQQEDGMQPNALSLLAVETSTEDIAHVSNDTANLYCCCCCSIACVQALQQKWGYRLPSNTCLHCCRMHMAIRPDLHGTVQISAKPVSRMLANELELHVEDHVRR